MQSSSFKTNRISLRLWLNYTQVAIPCCRYCCRCFSLTHSRRFQKRKWVCYKVRLFFTAFRPHAQTHIGKIFSKDFTANFQSPFSLCHHLISFEIFIAFSNTKALKISMYLNSLNWGKRKKRRGWKGNTKMFPKKAIHNVNEVTFSSFTPQKIIGLNIRRKSYYKPRPGRLLNGNE